MSLWLIRAGKYGEHENKFIDDSRIFLTWENLNQTDLTSVGTYEAVKAVMLDKYPAEPSRRLGNWSGQVWAFVGAMQPGDWVIFPRRSTGSIAVGEIKSGYIFDASQEPTYRHYRTVEWLNTDVPRSAFDQDLLYSFGAILTICEIKRNDAEKRVRLMGQRSWRGAGAGAGANAIPPMTTTGLANNATSSAVDAEIDLEELARDAIAKLIIQKFMGHGMARLVEAVLKAQGFTTHLSPEGPDRGIDILAAGGPFGFERPKICVQVKSGDTPADRPEFTQLIGAMQGVGADQGLFVSWSGFKQTVMRELPAHFFKVRLWNANDLIEQLLENYEKLDPDVRADLPLKRIWTIASLDE